MSLPDSTSRMQSVLDALAQDIRRNGLRVGDKLPPEREIAEHLGVSRAVVREALRHWATLGVVEKITGLGTFLRVPVTPDAEHFVVTLNPDRQVLLQTLEIRRALETEAAALAAVRATPGQIDELERLLEAVEAAYEQFDDAPEEDWAFHQAVYVASGNPLFVQLIEGILDLFHRFWQNPLNQPDFARRGLPQHRILVERIRAHDPEGARRATLDILQILEDELIP
ncbi:MAG: FadR family transcriptional regulator [Anaerolineae bacterium]|nr:FadR family transcriptional regulator [Anaerolineae bacterium]